MAIEIDYLELNSMAMVIDCYTEQHGDGDRLFRTEQNGDGVIERVRTGRT